MNTITITRDGAGIATLTVNLAERSMNVVTTQFIDEFGAAVEQLAADEQVRGVILASGKDSFMAGADEVIQHGVMRFHSQIDYC